MVTNAEGQSFSGIPDTDDDDALKHGASAPQDDDSDEQPNDPPVDDDTDETDDTDEDVNSWDAERGKKELSKRNKEAQRLRERLRTLEAQSAEERKELEEFRSAKLTEQEKLELRAKNGEQTASQLQAQLDEARIRLNLGLPEPDSDSDEDPFDDIPLRGDTFEERLASARRFAEKYKIGRFAAVEEEKPRPVKRTPDTKDLRSQHGNDDTEDDPVALANRVYSGRIGIRL